MSDAAHADQATTNLFPLGEDTTPYRKLSDAHVTAGSFEGDRLRLSCFDGAHAFLFDARLGEDGSLAGDRVLFVQEGYTPDVERLVAFLQEHGRLEHGVPDGMKTDERGNVYCTGHGGVWVISPDGELLGVIETPEIPANVAWGGTDGLTMFVCATRSLYAVPMRVRGALSVTGAARR